jgi:D-glycero-D-manno-heptose 1,7-bisphosphate phosphatase
MKTKVSYSWPNFRIDPSWTLFLDRDGVINRRLPMAYVREWDEFMFLDGVLESLPKMSFLFTRIFIVTNQAGIEKGLMSHEMLHEIHHKMLDVILFHGGKIDEIYYCPFTADLDPLCRKPNPGMALEAKKDFPEIEFSKSLMIGDSDSDIEFGNRLGMRTILVGDNNEAISKTTLAVPDAKMNSLADVADYFFQMTFP